MEDLIEELEEAAVNTAEAAALQDHPEQEVVKLTAKMARPTAALKSQVTRVESSELFLATRQPADGANGINSRRSLSRSTGVGGDLMEYIKDGIPTLKSFSDVAMYLKFKAEWAKCVSRAEMSA